MPSKTITLSDGSEWAHHGDAEQWFWRKRIGLTAWSQDVNNPGLAFSDPLTADDHRKIADVLAPAVREAPAALHFRPAVSANWLDDIASGVLSVADELDGRVAVGALSQIERLRKMAKRLRSFEVEEVPPAAAPPERGAVLTLWMPTRDGSPNYAYPMRTEVEARVFCDPDEVPCAYLIVPVGAERGGDSADREDVRTILREIIGKGAHDHYFSPDEVEGYVARFCRASNSTVANNTSTPEESRAITD